MPQQGHGRRNKPADQFHQPTRQQIGKWHQAAVRRTQVDSYGIRPDIAFHRPLDLIRIALPQGEHAPGQVESEGDDTTLSGWRFDYPD